MRATQQELDKINSAYQKMMELAIQYGVNHRFTREAQQVYANRINFKPASWEVQGCDKDYEVTQ